MSGSSNVFRIARISLVGAFSIGMLLVVPAESFGQLFRFQQLNRGQRFSPTENVGGARYRPGNAFQSGSRTVDVEPTVSRLPRWPFSPANGYDPRIHLDADRYSRYPKFIGGFHSSHFTNAGLPSGDIGFRGNGIYWTRW